MARGSRRLQAARAIHHVAQTSRRVVTGGFFVAAWSPVLAGLYLVMVYQAVQARRHPEREPGDTYPY